MSLRDYNAAADAADGTVDGVGVSLLILGAVVGGSIGTRPRAGAGRDAAIGLICERARHERERQREDEQQGNQAFFHEISSSLHDGDGEHDVERVHVLAVRGVGAYLCEVFERHAGLRLDDRKARTV